MCSEQGAARCQVRDKNKFRSGEITADRVAAYAEYKANLRALSEAAPGAALGGPEEPGAAGLRGAELLELEERQGFGFAMREGVALVTTPYVIVVQHDRNFTRPWSGLVEVRGSAAAAAGGWLAGSCR